MRKPTTKEVRDLSADALLFVGVCSITYCAHLLHPPAAYGVGGAGAIFLSWAVGRGG